MLRAALPCRRQFAGTFAGIQRFLLVFGGRCCHAAPSTETTVYKVPWPPERSNGVRWQTEREYTLVMEGARTIYLTVVVTARLHLDRWWRLFRCGRVFLSVGAKLLQFAFGTGMVSVFLTVRSKFAQSFDCPLTGQVPVLDSKSF